VSSNRVASPHNWVLKESACTSDFTWFNYLRIKHISFYPCSVPSKTTCFLFLLTVEFHTSFFRTRIPQQQQNPFSEVGLN
jgi:hypothetical protein